MTHLVFGLLVFAVALSVWFPYGRAKEVAISMAAAQDLDVEIGSAGPVFGLGVTFKDIRVSTRPVTGKPLRFIVDTARVKVSPFSLLSSTRSFSVSMDAFGGRIDLDQKGYPNRKGPFYQEVRIRDVNLKEIPGIREAINIPVTGTLRADLDISSPTGRYADATGSLTFACEACVVGDGKTPLKVEGNPFLAGGLTLPRVRLGEMGGHVKIEKGTGQPIGPATKHMAEKAKGGGWNDLTGDKLYSSAKLRFSQVDFPISSLASGLQVSEREILSGRLVPYHSSG